MASSGRKFQPPRGTRDFFPADMAVRRHIERAWRDVSTSHGFDEIEGPNFEHLELYTVKSGEGIVSELFSFRRSGGETDYALRPEFTPTLARMVAAHGNEYPKPIRWFCIPNHFRAERPQRGRLREFLQWNADVIGGENETQSDVELIQLTIDVLKRFGFKPSQISIRFSDRRLIESILTEQGIDPSRHHWAFQLLDRAPKISVSDFREHVAHLGLPAMAMEVLRTNSHNPVDVDQEFYEVAQRIGAKAKPLFDFKNEFDAEYGEWLKPDLTIARGLDYYTGRVFEVHETTGKERAIAGGGRYDNLVQLFGGPPTPAVGIAMGDVVLRLVLEDKGLIEKPEHYLPRPDVFVISAGSDEAEAQFRPLVARLRRAGFHARHSDRATRNVGKLLGEAGKYRAHLAVILGEELADGQVTIKNLDSGDQAIAPLDGLEDQLRAELAKSAQVETMEDS